MDFGGRIRAARRAAGLSQEELARRAGMSLKGMGDIERGDIDDPHFSSLSKIAKGLGVSIGELLEEPASPKAPAATSSTNPQSSSAVTEAEQQSMEAASPQAEEVDTRIKELMASPSFSAAKEKIEGWHFGSDAVESFIDHRVKAYEEELEDPHSPHFRTATAAALWAETLQREANMLARLGLEEVRPYLKNISRMSIEERGWAAVVTLKHIGRRRSAFENLLMRANELIAAMHDQPDVVAQKRLEKAQQRAEENQRQINEKLQELLPA
jgi:transcriptional regulator with XRE-family HTH domain